MTEDVLVGILDSNKSTGEKWAAVQQFVAEQVDVPTQMCNDLTLELERAHQAVDKAQAAIESKNPEAAAEALTAITVAKQSKVEREVAAIDDELSKLQARKEELLKAT